MTNENQDAKFSATNNLRDAMNTKRENLALQSENPECFYENADAATRAQLSDATAKVGMLQHGKTICHAHAREDCHACFPVGTKFTTEDPFMLSIQEADRAGFERGVKALRDALCIDAVDYLYVGQIAAELLAAPSEGEE